MTITIAALLYRPADVPEAALSRGFAVALGGWDVPAPALQIAKLPGLPDFSVAFYESGAPREDAAEHAIDLFEEELSPPVCVLDAAAELGHPDARVYALVYSEDFVHDDGWRFDLEGFERHFVRDGDDGIEAGVETPDDSDVQTLTIDVPEDASEAQESAVIDAALRPHRGTTFLSAALGVKVLPAVMRASFEVEHKVPVRLVEPTKEGVRAVTERLVRALGRSAGRGAFSPPTLASGLAAPLTVGAFAEAYDWHDPKDPEDHYRELSIGAVTGTLRFLREAEIQGFSADPAWKGREGEGYYPVAKLMASALGGQRQKGATLAVGADGDRLFLLSPGAAPKVAGPTFGELILYLALGWSRRSDAEEDLIGALMLRARLRG